MMMRLPALLLVSARGNFVPFCLYVLIKSPIGAVEGSWIFN
jgi:hypothetical protein